MLRCGSIYLFLCCWFFGHRSCVCERECGNNKLRNFILHFHSCFSSSSSPIVQSFCATHLTSRQIDTIRSTRDDTKQIYSMRYLETLKNWVIRMRFQFTSLGRVFHTHNTFCVFLFLDRIYLKFFKNFSLRSRAMQRDICERRKI